MEIGFLPRISSFNPSVLLSSVLAIMQGVTTYMHMYMYVYMSVQVLFKTQWNNELEQVCSWEVCSLPIVHVHFNGRSYD